jgi:hypothetical protein
MVASHVFLKGFLNACGSMLPNVTQQMGNTVHAFSHAEFFLGVIVKDGAESNSKSFVILISKAKHTE